MPSGIFFDYQPHYYLLLVVFDARICKPRLTLLISFIFYQTFNCLFFQCYFLKRAVKNLNSTITDLRNIIK